MGSQWESNRRKGLFKRQNGKCFWCGKMCFNPRERKIPKPDVTFTTDHVVPRGRGGSNTVDNIVGACYPCNQTRNKVEQLLKDRRKPGFVVKAKYLPVGFLKFNPVQKMDK